MGTPEFAVASLDVLVKQGCEVVAVITAPDKPAGRGQLLRESAVKKYALDNHLKILQPVNLKDELFVSELRSLGAHLQIVVAFRMLPAIIWEMPLLGTYNLHASHLPKYRGAAPINWAIIRGESRTGVTSFKLEHEIDTGSILFQNAVEIDDTITAGELHDTLMMRGADLILKTVLALQAYFESGKPLMFMPQNDSEATHAPKLNRETCRINWALPGKEIHNLIRGLSPHPCAFTVVTRAGRNPLVLKVYRASFQRAEHHLTNGSLITDSTKHLRVCCPGGFIQIDEMQLEGKKRMKTDEFLKGFKVDSQTLLS